MICNGWLAIGRESWRAAVCRSTLLAGWEGKDDFVRHRLIAVTNRVMSFDGLTLVPEGPEHYTVYLWITDGPNKGQVLAVHQTRVSRHRR